MMAVGEQVTNSGNDKEGTTAVMGYRPAVVPMLVYIGAALKNAGTILTEIAPWAYLGFVVLLIGMAQAIQRRQRKAWPWSIALTVGFVIALIAWLGSMAIVNVFAPSEARPG